MPLPCSTLLGAHHVADEPQGAVSDGSANTQRRIRVRAQEKRKQHAWHLRDLTVRLSVAMPMGLALITSRAIRPRAA